MKKIILLLSCTLLLGCVTLPDFITKKDKEVRVFTADQQRAIGINDAAIEIDMNNYGVRDSLPKIIELLEQALAIDSTNKTIHKNYLQYLTKQQDSVKLVLAAERLVRSLPNDAGSWLQLGVLLDMYGLRPLEAIECYKKAKVLYKKDGDVVNQMLATLLEGGEESKKPQFISDFKVAFQLAGYDEKVYSVIENYNKLEFLRFINGISSIYDNKALTGEDDFEAAEF